MRGVALLVLMGLVACVTADAVTLAAASSDLHERRTANGEQLSKNEFAAVVAACEDRAKSGNESAAIESCFADYGLSRTR